MQFFVTLDGKLIRPSFPNMKMAQALGEEHIRAGTNAEVAVDCYQDEATMPMHTARYDRVSKKWVK